MLRIILLSVIALLSIQGVSAQLKPHYPTRPLPASTTKPKIEDLKFYIPDVVREKLQAIDRPPATPLKLVTSDAALTLDHNGLVRDQATGLPIYLPNSAAIPPLVQSRSAVHENRAYSFLEYYKDVLQVEDPQESFRLTGVMEDELGQRHLRFTQYYQGVEMYGSEIILHEKDGAVALMNGHYLPEPTHLNTRPDLTPEAAVQQALTDLAGFAEMTSYTPAFAQIYGDRIQGQRLVIYHPAGAAPRLAYYLEAAAHPLSRWAYWVDAHTGEVIHKISLVCTLMPHLDKAGAHAHTHKAPKLPVSLPVTAAAAEFDGPTTAVATDLLGVNRTINVYQHQSVFLGIDISREMFNANASNFPDNVVGGIWTIDAGNTSPADEQNFNVTHVFSNDNTWNQPDFVSAHHNAALAYEYFRQTFNRNSINGQGGTIISLINVADEDGSGLDNAFWNGSAMFYGNGNTSFKRLAAGLDVGGHEMSHGVIQFTAALEYQGESGALNESYADIFGAMIDRDDWEIGEDVVQTSVFPSGALRSLRDPNQGQSGLGAPGWQPAHTDQQYLGDQDNGGVHINSGIPNRAFYLYATAVGKDKAEQVFYRALSTYLTRSSQFIDARLAVIRSAQDLYGAAEANAAAAAFDQVGITGDTPATPDPVEYDANPGDQYVLVVEASGNGLYLFEP